MVDELIHIKRAKINTTYRVKYSDDDKFNVGDYVSVTRNKRVIVETNQSGTQLACPNTSEFECKNNTSGKKYRNVSSVYITEDLSD